jgi:Amt family ammonium transporter
MPPHDIIIGAVGGLILWFGWYGFNPGSTLSAMDTQGIGRVAFTTTMAACSAGLTALFISYFRSKKWDLGLTVNGFLAGLVAITAPCYWVSPTGAFIIGIIAAFVVVWAMDLLEYMRIDDPIGAVPVHMFCGVWGTLSLGLFATGEFGLPTPTGADTSSVLTGLFYGGGFHQLQTQLIGSMATLGVSLILAFALMYAVKATGTLRVSQAGEIEGLDIHEHGMPAYPEFVMMGRFNQARTPTQLIPQNPSKMVAGAAGDD